jgi:hypothetical protein
LLKSEIILNLELDGVKYSLCIDNTTQHVFSREVNSIIFDRFFAADYDCVLELFPARQDFEIIGLLSVKKAYTAI